MVPCVFNIPTKIENSFFPLTQNNLYWNVEFQTKSLKMPMIICHAEMPQLNWSKWIDVQILIQIFIFSCKM